jgi:hypothetical protein
MNTPLGNFFFITIAYLYGIYKIGFGIYAWRVSRFMFYLTTGFLIGVPFLAAGTYILLSPRAEFPALGIIIGLIWALGMIMKVWCLKSAKKHHPVEWNKWETFRQEN